MADFLVRVQPKSSQSKVLVEDGLIRVWVTAPPADGAANDAVIKLLAKSLGVAKSKVEIVSGLSSRSKRVCVDGLEDWEVMRLLDC